MSLEASTVIRVGSRKSQLALLQTDIIINLLQNFYPDYKFEIVKISTTGDKILDKALSKIGDKNLFTKELETALLNNEVDFVVHSLKDVPTVMPEGLVIGCISSRVSPFDVVLMNPANRGKTLKDLPPNSVIGTSALRRIAVLKRKFPDLCFKSVRGNLATRLQKLDSSAEEIINENGATQKYSALILAEAGVLRVGWESRIDEYLDLDRYAVGQGALACECRLGDTRIQSLLSTIHSEAPTLACIAERAFMSRLEGGCSTPIAVRTYLNPGGVAGIKGDDSGQARTMSLDAAVLSLDGTKCVEGKMSTDLPFFMPWDCPKRARRDELENSSQPLFLNDEISEAEGECAEDENAIILGVQVSPICCIGRLRMVRARSLGEALADHLHAAGAGEILAEIRATGTSKSDPVEPKQTREAASANNEMTGKPKNKRKAFYRRCAAGEQRAKQRRLEALGEAEGKVPIRRLEPGMTGFLFTSNNKDIHQAQVEVYRLLNEANTRINGSMKEEEEKVAEKQNSNEDDDYIDFASALKEELKSDSKYGRYIFNGVKTGVSNCGFVLNQSERNSSADLINNIFQYTMEKGEADTRRVLRFIPVVGTCKPDTSDLSALLRRSFRAYWDSSVEGIENLLPLCLICPKVPLQRAKFIEKPNSADAKLYFTVNFKARNYDKMKKEEAVMTVIATLQEIAPEWSPITHGADLIISVDVVCNVLCLSFLEKYNEFAKYNIQQAAEMSSVNSKTE